MKKVILATTLAAMTGALSAHALTTDITVDTEFAFESEYSFRGVKLGGPSLQPGMEIGIMDGYVGTWMSMPLKRGPGAGDNEVDFYGGWVFPAGDMAEVDIGYTYYWFPEGGSEREPYIGIAFDVPFEPAVYAFYETEGEVFTLEGSAGYEYELTEFGFTNTALEFGGYVGYVTNDEDWVYYGVTSDIVYALNDSVEFSAGVRFAGNSESIEPDQQLWWGTAVSVAY